MAQRYIYIQDELNNKLKNEENASALIQRLLYEHYKFSNIISSKDIDKRITEIKEEANNQVESTETEIEKLERLKLEAERKEEEKVEEVNQVERIARRKREGINHYFKDITGRDITDYEYGEFLQAYEAGKCDITIYAEKTKIIDDSKKNA